MVFVRILRPIHSLSRLLKPNRITSRRYVTGTAVKEEINTELLNAYNQDILAGGTVPVFRRALLFPTRVALQDEVGIYTYAGLHQAATALSNEIANMLSGETERTVAYMCGNDASHVIVQWAIWMSGNIAVPLTPLHPPEMLDYFLSDSGASLSVCTQEHEKTMRPLTVGKSRPLLVTTRDNEITAQLYQPNTTFLKAKPEENLSDAARDNMWYGKHEALIIYTSGTTSKPKGVVWSHSMLSHQIASLHTAWQYSASDVVLHTLPLHHIHGQLNSLNASLAAGARIRMLPTFTAHAVWARLLGMGERDECKVTVFHGVPAMYAKLAQAHEQMFSSARTAQYVRGTLEGRIRTMCSGSAPLVESLARRWLELSGVRLLERYGMSEVGMALSNPYKPATERTVGAVGLPLPGVAAAVAAAGEAGAGAGAEPQLLLTVEAPMSETQICLQRLGIPSSKDVFVDSDNFIWKPPTITDHQPSPDGTYTGELLLKGPGVFSRYLNKPATDFTKDGWFRTGDIVTFSDGKFRILGRNSVDIIKTGGYKVSALQIETAILENSNIVDVAVIGVDDDTYGEVVGAVVVLKPNVKITLTELRAGLESKLAPYQLPRSLVVAHEMPRNAMSKLDKKVLKTMYAKELVIKKP